MDPALRGCDLLEVDVAMTSPYHQLHPKRARPTKKDQMRLKRLKFPSCRSEIQCWAEWIDWGHQRPLEKDHHTEPIHPLYGHQLQEALRWWR